MTLQPDHDYIIEEGQRGDPAYAIRTLARWIRPADLPQFHVMKTVEIVPRQLIVHLHQIKPAPAIENSKAKHKNGA